MASSASAYGAPQDWNATQFYNVGLAVVHDNVLYRCLRNNIDEEPPGSAWLAIISGNGIPVVDGIAYTTPCLTIGTDTDNQTVVCGSATGDPISVSATGSDASIPVTFSDKAGAGVSLVSGGLTALLAQSDGTVGVVIVNNDNSNTLTLFGGTGADDPLVLQLNGGNATHPVNLGLSPHAGGAVIVQNDPSLIADIFSDIIANSGAEATLVVAGKNSSFVQYGFNGNPNNIETMVTGGAPGALDPTSPGSEMLHWTFKIVDGGAWTEVGTLTVAYNKVTTPGSTWSLTSTDTASGTSAPFLVYDATTRITTLGRALAGETTVLAGDGASTAGTMTVGVRTGTPAKFACFDTNGVLVESAVACV